MLPSLPETVKEIFDSTTCERIKKACGINTSEKIDSYLANHSHGELVLPLHLSLLLTPLFLLMPLTLVKSKFPRELMNVVSTQFHFLW